MSGGVDSSVAAAILKKEGYQVIGVTMHIWPSDNQARDADNYDGCCGASAVADARRVAHMLGIPHYVMDFKEVFARKVIDNFYREYVLGRTPNPCIRCNHYVKFDALLDRAKGLGADFVATGHHARVTKNGNEDRYLLKKGIDQRKDQSYVLYSLTQQQLKHILLPVYMANYLYGTKQYHFLINGQTGEVQGTWPIHWGKVAAVIGSIVAAALGIAVATGAI